MKSCLTNCLTSTILSVLLCKNGCKIDKVAEKLAYFPPDPPTYEVVEVGEGDGNGDGEGGAARGHNDEDNRFRFRLKDKDLLRWHEAVRASMTAEAFRMKTSRGNDIPAIMFRSSQAKFTILFSHSNAIDIGVMVDFFCKLSSLLSVNMFCYEYSGYGDSKGSPPSEKNTYADIESAFAKLNDLGVDASRIILYGQSVGSGPSCYLASRESVRGLILHGPLMSGLNVVSRAGCCRPSFLFRCCDIYRNIDRVKRVQCPVLVMHGHDDEVIQFSHGRKLHEATRGNARYAPYWVPGAGHNNLLETDPDGYLQVMRDFLVHVENNTARPITHVS